MSKLYLAFSFMKDGLGDNYSLQKVSKGTPLYDYYKGEYRSGELYETFDGNLIVPKTTCHEEKNMVFKTALKELKTKITRYRSPYGCLENMAYYRNEYPRGSFCESIDGNLLIPDVLENDIRVKEKVL